MKRGRPPKSEIRQNLLELLTTLGKAYGYQLAKLYLDRYPATTKRNIYYHLKKGVALGEIIIDEIAEEKGEYSWGNKAEKVYYQLGPNAQIKQEKA